MAETRITEDFKSVSCDESVGDKFRRKLQETPFLPAGVLGCLGVLGFGIHKFKHQGVTNPSLFLVQLRVASQGMVVGALCLGILATVTNKILLPDENKKD